MGKRLEKPKSGDNRVFFALDVDTMDEAKKYFSMLAMHTAGFKIGKEFAAAVGLPQAIAEARKWGADIFCDQKYFDIPNTVSKASTVIGKHDVRVLNVHCLGGPEMMEKTMEALHKEFPSGDRPAVIGVTILTSWTYDTLVAVGLASAGIDFGGEAAKQFKDEFMKKTVLRLAKLAQSSGLDGVVASPQETSLIREACGEDFLIMTPGVRPAFAAVDDQKRIMTPGEAVQAGADYLVIGRPIANASEEIGGPVGAINLINEETMQAKAA